MNRVTLHWRDFSTDFESARKEFATKSCVYALLSREGHPAALYIGMAADGLQRRYSEQLFSALLSECGMLNATLSRLLDEARALFAKMIPTPEGNQYADLVAKASLASTRFVVAEVEREQCAAVEETLIDRELPRFNRQGVQTVVQGGFETRIGYLPNPRVELVHVGDVPFRSHADSEHSKSFQMAFVGHGRTE